MALARLILWWRNRNVSPTSATEIPNEKLDLLRRSTVRLRNAIHQKAVERRIG